MPRMCDRKKASKQAREERKSQHNPPSKRSPHLFIVLLLLFLLLPLPKPLYIHPSTSSSSSSSSSSYNPASSPNVFSAQARIESRLFPPFPPWLVRGRELSSGLPMSCLSSSSSSISETDCTVLGVGGWMGGWRWRGGWVGAVGGREGCGGEAYICCCPM